MEPGLPYIYVPPADWVIITDMLKFVTNEIEDDSSLKPICDAGTSTCKWNAPCEAVRKAY